MTWDHSYYQVDKKMNTLNLDREYIPVGMAVNARWLPVRGPPGVSNPGMGNEGSVKIGLRLFDQLLQLCNLADFLESKNFAFLVPINCNTCGVISTIFKAVKA